MISGLLVAAGAGSRYGRPKILVPGWLDHAVTVLREGGCAHVLVVTGAARPPLPPGAGEVHCPGWGRGPGASVRAGLEALHPEVEAVVIHLVDLPDVGADVVRRVLGADGLARAVYEGRPGHPVLVGRRFVPSLLESLDDASGAGRFLRDHPELTEVECADLATGVDVDHPIGGTS